VLVGRVCFVGTGIIGIHVVVFHLVIIGWISLTDCASLSSVEAGHISWRLMPSNILTQQDDYA